MLIFIAGVLTGVGVMAGLLLLVLLCAVSGLDDQGEPFSDRHTGGR